MSIKKKLLISLFAVIVIIAVFIGFALKKIYTPTQGVKISKYDNPRKALLIIDVQEDFSGLRGKQPVPLKNVEGQIAIINGLINNAYKSGMEVIYIRQIFDDNFIMRNVIGRAIEGQAGAELDARVTVISKNDFTKKISDAFSNPALDKFLVENRIDELYLTGLDAAYCVYYTALGAKNRGYKFFVVKDAVMTQKNMPDVLRQYDKDGIPAITSKEIMGHKLEDAQ